VVLRKLSENYNNLPTVIIDNFPFIGYLIPYFEKHTLLDAALIAGFIGAVTQYIILTFLKIPKNFNNSLYFLIVSFVVSALFGFIMKFSKLFPNLDETYYKNLGPVRGMYHDGVSGLIVQITLLFLNKFI
jgi:uncharacterized membrane protein YeaQ/YmgE (transglycosylase-associated protein family)